VFQWFFWEIAMLNFDVAKLEKVVEDLRALLKDGLLATDISDRASGLSLAGHNSQPAAVALFGRVTEELVEALSGSGFPGLGRFYMLDLEGDHTVVLIRHGDDLLQGILMASKKVNMGILFSIAIPRALDGVAKARG
jgi:hypothetical protein